MLEVKPITLEGKVVRLEFLQATHLPDLFQAAQNDEIWNYLLMARPQTLADLQSWFEAAMEGWHSGVILPFAIIEQATNRVIGSTRYLAISKTDYSVEIGYTWLGRDYWRTAVNTECKYLLLRHAFEVLGCIRVWFKADARNLNSQRALARIGAKKEGVLRKHMIVRNGYQRDSVVFSILDDEWPEVKTSLEERLGLVE
ncbi:MAG: GNAT family protein [Chloroflexota bacterium]|nr:GNAT family N-acetyltransferase [Chloroflexota bacterium]